MATIDRDLGRALVWLERYDYADDIHAENVTDLAALLAEVRAEEREACAAENARLRAALEEIRAKSSCRSSRRCARVALEGAPPGPPAPPWVPGINAPPRAVEDATSTELAALRKVAEAAREFLAAHEKYSTGSYGEAEDALRAALDAVKKISRGQSHDP